MRNLLAVALLLLVLQVNAQQKDVIAFYNVENLFDTIDDPHTKDNEFLPQSAKKWTSARYKTKLEHTAEAINSIRPENLPVFIGLCEIENKGVVKDLIDQAKLKKGSYGIIHQESPDKRGIDCAAIYRKDKLTVKEVYFQQIHLPNHKDASTRDIIVVNAVLENKFPLYIFVNHWPSRLGGEEKSEGNRFAVARTLKHLCDSIGKKHPEIPQLILGDFNDSPSDSSIVNILGADTSLSSKSKLFNLTYSLQKENKGSYFYQNHWEMLDNVIVSKSLLKSVKRAQIHQNPLLLYKSKKGVLSPARTYSGKQYHGGYSDHLPVYVEIVY